jgi:low affinity Fe/Cu permease
MLERVFSQAANKVSDWAGSPGGFTLALGAMVVWAALGPLVGYSEVWQLAVNTGTTIVTFLMVFIIQNSQNRDSRALQIKMDELIRATKGASNSLLDLETLSATEIGELHDRYCRIAARAKELGIAFDQGTPPAEVAEAAQDVAEAMEDKQDEQKGSRGRAANGKKVRAPSARRAASAVRAKSTAPVK